MCPAGSDAGSCLRRFNLLLNPHPSNKDLRAAGQLRFGGDTRPDRVDKDANLASPAAFFDAVESESGGFSDFLAVRLQTIPSMIGQVQKPWDRPMLDQLGPESARASQTNRISARNEPSVRFWARSPSVKALRPGTIRSFLAVVLGWGRKLHPSTTW